MRTVQIDGATWVRHAERRCARCHTRTYRVSRRDGQELVLRALPGPTGAHGFTSARGRLFALCTRCVTDLGGPGAVRAWASAHL